MAQFETQLASAAIAQAIKKLQENNMFSDKTVTAILTIGADEMLASVKSAFIQSGHNNTLPRRTGETLRHFTKSRKLMKDKRGTPYMFVTVSGSDRRGQRYGAKAFVLNHDRRKGGRSHQIITYRMQQSLHVPKSTSKWHKRLKNSLLPVRVNERRMKCLNLICAA